MADALVSVVLEQLSSIIVSEVWELQKKVELVTGVKKEVENLQKNFQAIKAVLADAEQRQLKEGSIKLWMGQLKDVSYDIDDVLDEWSTAIAKSQKKVNDEHPRKTIKKVCSSMIFSCFCFREVRLRSHVARDIQTLNGRIDGIVSEKKKFHLKLSEGEIKPPEHKITTSVIDVTKIKGRETNRSTIVKMLLGESSDQEQAPRTISLVGTGGIGKTTLAQLVYNNQEVETHFGKRIWVCVSDPFDEIRIAKAILEGLKESAHDLNELQALLERIQESIRGKRFLLVLDDVWNQDSTKWEQLENSLKRGCLPGSRILVTTRNTKVASIMGSSSSTDILEVGLLSPDECWSLFSHFAFYEKNSRERENLEETGRKIAERCKGLPLAAKTLGSLLRFKRSRAEWESVLNNHVWEIKEAESNLLAPLWLSYHDLPTEMRPCFLYCAVFPKDYIFRRDTLIKLWMAQGFLRETQNQEMEVTGGECFEALAARSFFQDFKKDEDGGSNMECKMHDIVHDFAQFMTKNESFIVEFDGGPAELKIDSFSRDARHSMVVLNYDTDSFTATIHSFKKLRSLIVDGCPSSMNAALPNLIANLSCLRTLKLSNCGIEEVPSNIGKLIHLRLVDLSHNEIKELPEEMCELYNMQTLDVSFCGGELEKLPDNIGKLIKLRHLSVRYLNDSSFVKMRGFEGLGCLRELDEFHVSGSGEGSNIGGLKNLNHLQGYLKIKWLGDVKDPDEVKKAGLKSKKNLTALGLWFGSRTDSGMIRHDEILEALEPPPNIDSLKIGDYQGIIQVLPSWINKLRVVGLYKWGKMENLYPLGKMPFLEDLTVSSMESVRKVGSEFLGMEAAAADDSEIGIGEMTASPSNTIIAFPMLKTLNFYNLREWEEWEGEGRRNEDRTIMPSLRSLRIWDCPKLKALPDYIYQSTTLEKLNIINSPILEEQFKEGGKGWPNTSHTPNITFTLE